MPFVKKYILQVLPAAGAMLLLSCHAAFFQTAVIRENNLLTAGIVRNQADGTENLYDYSLFTKLEKGAAATHETFGTSFGLTGLVPFNIGRPDYPTGGDQGFVSTPNGEFGLYPEVKVQMMNRYPVDMASSLRLHYLMPERLALFFSKDIALRYTVYNNYGIFFNGSVNAALGLEVLISTKHSVFVEFSQWLTAYRYVEGYGGADRVDRPFSLGVAFITRQPFIAFTEKGKSE